MNPGRILLFGLVAVGLAVGSMVESKASDARSHQLIGKAPFFSASTAGGKTYDLKTATEKGPVYLFFIKKDCPITAGAMHFYTDIGKAYGDKSHILGVFSGDAKEYKEYNAEHKLTFPTVLDPKLEMIASYKVDNSPWIIEVKQGGAIGHIWKGYSQPFLDQINRSVAAAAGKPMAKIDFSDAGKDPAYG